MYKLRIANNLSEVYIITSALELRQGNSVNEHKIKSARRAGLN